MDKLSELIREARPLYKKRKRQRAVIFTTLALFVPFFVFTTCVQIYNTGNDLYTALSNNDLIATYFEDEFGLFEEN